MPTNRRRITRSRTAIVDWKIDFLLYGETQHSSGEPGRKSILPFTARREFGGGCLADPLNWKPLWDQFKDDLLPQYRKDHPGKKCWAERELARGK